MRKQQEKNIVRQRSLEDSDAGRSFILKAKNDAWTLTARAAWWALLIFNTLAFIGNLWKSPTFLYPVLMPFHGFTYLFLIATRVSHFLPQRQFLAWPLFTVYVVVSHLLTLRLSITHLGEVSLESGAINLVVCLMATMLMPGPLIHAICVASVASLGTLVAVYGAPYGIAYTIMVTTSAFGGVIWSAVVLDSVKQTAVASLAMRMIMAPAHVAERALEGAGVSGGFPLSERHTAVIVMKWSELATQSHEMRPELLDALLNSYYSMVDQILLTQLPSGAWYADVIQHEIVIYVFTSEHQSPPEIAAMRFASQLMQARKRHREMDVMGHLDIGVASGPITSGIVGPQLYKKTAAIGDAMTEAIKAKSLGVPLRLRIGGFDRLLLADSVVAVVGQEYPVRQIQDPVLLRKYDWSNDSIFVLDDEAYARRPKRNGVA